MLAEWRHLDASELPRTELLRHVIEHSLLAAHRHVFGVFFWFVVLSALRTRSGRRRALPHGRVRQPLLGVQESHHRRARQRPPDGAFATICSALIDHVPARLTAFGFAVVGNFEEAVTCWRRDAALWKYPNEGIILAAAAGAVGVQLGGAAAPGVTPDRSQTFEGGASPEAAEARGSTPGLPAQPGHLRSVVGLVWRSVVLWMLLLALLSLANLMG